MSSFDKLFVVPGEGPAQEHPMRARTFMLVLALGLLGCVTINLYFPEGEVKDLAQQIETEVQEKAVEGGTVPAEEVPPAMLNVCRRQLVHHGRIAGQERADLDAEWRERAGQGAGDIGEAAGLDQRKDFRRDRQDAQAAHAASAVSRLIMGVVMRQMPLSVRRKRRASSSGSSPTTRPSGMCTPRSTTTFFSRTCWPISA